MKTPTREAIAEFNAEYKDFIVFWTVWLGWLTLEVFELFYRGAQ